MGSRWVYLVTVGGGITTLDRCGLYPPTGEYTCRALTIDHGHTVTINTTCKGTVRVESGLVGRFHSEQVVTMVQLAQNIKIST